MRKVILPLVIALALVASLGATASYYARVDMEVDPEVGSTTLAELAFDTGEDAVADEFVIVTGNPAVVSVDYGDIQADSNYNYYWVVEVTNNKPYDVCLRVKSADGQLDDTNDGVGFQVWMTDDRGTTNLTLIYDEEGIDTPVTWFCIPDGETVYMSFEVMTSSYQGTNLGSLSAGSYQGTFQFEAQGPTTCDTCPP